MGKQQLLKTEKNGPHDWVHLPCLYPVPGLYSPYHYCCCLVGVHALKIRALVLAHSQLLLSESRTSRNSKRTASSVLQTKSDLRFALLCPRISQEVLEERAREPLKPLQVSLELFFQPPHPFA
mmetsp:Transcript_6713/g.10462  ORF Transcript_6713/g.10462 Transcript_6713/m.10462 type:complete len:123 (-) Transcript_6713:233-601(-)